MSAIKRVVYLFIFLAIIFMPAIVKRDFSIEVFGLVVLGEAIIVTFIIYSLIFKDFFARLPIQEPPSMFGWAGKDMYKETRNQYAERQYQTDIVVKYGLTAGYVSTIKILTIMCIFGASISLVTLPVLFIE